MSTPSPWDNFTMEELTCPCGCGLMLMSPQLMEVLVNIRSQCGFPLPVTSGYRCPDHNEAVSNTGLYGPHTTGKAVDISVYGDRAHMLMSRAVEHGITGIGVRQKGKHKSRFIHLDVLTAEETAGLRPWLWSY